MKRLTDMISEASSLEVRRMMMVAPTSATQAGFSPVTGCSKNPKITPPVTYTVCRWIVSSRVIAGGDPIHTEQGK
jgi:hypothetical protein